MTIDVENIMNKYHPLIRQSHISGYELFIQGWHYYHFEPLKVIPLIFPNIPLRYPNLPQRNP